MFVGAFTGLVENERGHISILGKKIIWKHPVHYGQNASFVFVSGIKTLWKLSDTDRATDVVSILRFSGVFIGLDGLNYKAV